MASLNGFSFTFGIFYNLSLLYALFQEGKFKYYAKMHNHERITVMLVVAMLACSISESVFYWVQVTTGKSIREDPILCDYSAIVCLLGGGVLLGVLLIFALDRLFQVVFFKTIHPGTLLAIFVALETIPSAGILFTLFPLPPNGNHHFYPVNTNYWCFFKVFIEDDENGILSIAPAIAIIITMFLVIVFICCCYLWIYFFVRGIRREADEFRCIDVEDSSIISHHLTSHKSNNDKAVPLSESKVASANMCIPASTHSHDAAVHARYSIQKTNSNKTKQLLDKKLEREVFYLCVVLLSILLFCWTPMFLCFMIKVAAQKDYIPQWFEFLAMYLVSLDYAFLTTTALIRFSTTNRMI